MQALLVTLGNIFVVNAGPKRLRRAMVVVPTTLIDTWMTELQRVGAHAMRCTLLTLLGIDSSV
jgi:hypothetical protein